MKRIRLIISGRVQGVLFRYNTKKIAKNLDLRGFVKNLQDGTVEVIAEGSEEKLNKFIEFCKKGPMLAHVTDVRISYENYKGEFKEFEVRH